MTIVYEADPTRFQEAVTYRILDRAKPDVTWPEIAVVGPVSPERLSIATRLRRAGISTIVERNTKKALRSDPDWLLFSDSLRLKSCHDEGEIVLFSETLETGAMFAMNVGYLPSKDD